MKDMPKKYHLTLKINFPKGQLLLFIVSFIYWWRKFFSHESEYHMTEIVKVGRTDEIKKEKKKIGKRPADLIILTVKTTVYLPFLTESQALVLSMTFTHLFAKMEPIFERNLTVSLGMFLFWCLDMKTVCHTQLPALWSRINNWCIVFIYLQDIMVLFS